MNITDNNGNLIAIYQKGNEIEKEKNFLTDNSEEFQFGTFNLPKGEIIKNHIHENQERTTTGTSEALVILDGELKVTFFDNKKEFISSIILEKSDSIVIYSGGHGLEVINDCKFVEIKQGPYIENKDKTHF